MIIGFYFKMNNAIFFEKTWYDALKSLDDGERLKAYDAIFDYCFYGIDIDLKPPTSCIVPILRPQLDRYIKISDNKGGRHCGEYVKWRDNVFVRDNYTCQQCGNRGVELNAHHIKEYAKYPALRYDVDNGITLCVKCHKKIHKKEKRNA